MNTKLQKIGLYPGSFDPITKGHMDIVKKALNVFDKVVIAVVKNSSKNMLFTLEERQNLIQQIFADDNRVTCIALESKLTVELAEEIGACAIVRGLRAMSDFEYEFQITGINRSQNKNIETIFFAADDKLTFVSSSMVKEIAAYKGKIGKFVAPIVKEALKQRVKISDN